MRGQVHRAATIYYHLKWPVSNNNNENFKQAKKQKILPIYGVGGGQATETAYESKRMSDLIDKSKLICSKN